MKATPFQFPFRHFPGIPRSLNDAEVAATKLLIFAEVSGDKGLRNACKVFWNLKKVSVYQSSGICSPTHTSYAAGTILPSPTNDETLMHPPALRCVNPAVKLPNNSAGVLATIDAVSSVFIDEIVWLETLQCYAVTLPVINSADAWYGVATNYPGALHYTFYARNSSPGDAAITVSLPPEFKPIGAGSPTRFYLQAGSTATPTVAISFEFWQY
jgi:hypothetical protein